MKAAFRRLVRPLLELQVKRLIAAKHLKVVAVTGAIGKTSTKLAIATVLGQKYRVMVHAGNFNAEIGLPLAVFGLEVPQPIVNPVGWLRVLAAMERQIKGSYPYDCLVLELGTDHPGEIPHFMTYLSPDVGVVTAVAAEHMEFFHTLDAVAAEEMSLIPGSKQSLAGRDDVPEEYWQQYAAPHRALSYGLEAGRDYAFALAGTDPVKGTQGTFSKADAVVVAGTRFNRYGRHSAKAVTAAVAVGDLLGLTADQLRAGLAAIQPVSGRMQPLRGQHGALIIDDTYNSSPEAAAAALEVLMAIPEAKRRIAVMGSMNELGDTAPQYHTQLGVKCARVSMLITVGALTKDYLGPAAVMSGLSADQWRHFESPYAAGKWLQSHLQKGDVILAKGSQGGIFLEETVKLLLADPGDTTKLVRQSPTWLRTKAAAFSDSPHH